MEMIILFTGHFAPEAFGAFVRHRAARLNLAATILDSSLERVRVAVSGGAEMIEAFELACSLGPASCLVRDVTREAA